MTYDDNKPPERPRAEPEIIPPDRGGRRSDWRNAPYQNNWQNNWQNNPFTGARGTQRIYVTRVGPVGIALLMLAIAAILAIVVVAALGVVLIWVPVLVAIIAGAALLRRFRGFGPR
jgi:hypothetical protein